MRVCGQACLVLDHNPAMISCRGYLMPLAAAVATLGAHYHTAGAEAYLGSIKGYADCT